MKKPNPILEEKITELLEESIIVEIANEYGEPGYSVDKDKLGIALGNWNDVDRSLADEIAEYYMIEWGDEWTVRDGKAWRTQPDCYGWLPSIVEVDGDIMTIEDLKTSAGQERYIEEYLLNNPRHGDTFGGIEGTLKEMGFHVYNGEYATGLHIGDDDDPKEVYKKLGGQYDVVFQVSGKDQFTVNWVVWVRELAQCMEAE